ncbi:AHH domain-containing protein [Aliivibrio fischeri]|uniref:AHH domain-containing protein n=1 Tax=Aliivibrio fischeri TaxID=668 RepID=UPI0007C5A2BC|nr:AHH domain-containing protein [Aliivibrio fischeri]MCE7557194.1 AHH domain-containing protein [Aliivibrio fischeri]MCE7564464.1 AHH domain-containing protein [Aliivibrio fischeri]MCE7568188.1 AHH domain-containing protein [Aliivibrio fischeri]MCE7571872.1 AHH domain-containing protein [Aliivibrio fischeri]MUK94670.1 hypothetical protein [Aliivibrio fischeri]
MTIYAKSLLKNRGKPGHGSNTRNSDAWESIKKHNSIFNNPINGNSSANHPWFYKSSSIAAHHIIPIECMQNSIKWERLCKVTGYNINHWRNISILPMCSKLACQLGVQIHIGPHDAGRYGTSNYIQGVKNKIAYILDDLDEGELCDESLSDIVKEIDNISKNILSDIDNFSCTISRLGTDYDKGRLGCRNLSKNESEKFVKDALITTCTHRKKDNLGLGHNLIHLFKNNLIITKKGKLKVGH